jgi:hypothetical protein
MRRPLLLRVGDSYCRCTGMPCAMYQKLAWFLGIELVGVRLEVHTNTAEQLHTVSCVKHHQPVASVGARPRQQPDITAIKPDLLPQLATCKSCPVLYYYVNTESGTESNYTLTESALTWLKYCTVWIDFTFQLHIHVYFSGVFKILNERCIHTYVYSAINKAYITCCLVLHKQLFNNIILLVNILPLLV